ncbi:MAG TPA: hypothetical protein EYN66_00780, partial [Myxococcales bacterium]|nr:hypothetical protein [Myxococcales bacterium]
AAFFLMSSSMGGLEEAAQKVIEVKPKHFQLGSGGLFEPSAWASYGLAISLTVIAFPHMFVRLMAAKSDAALKGASRIYPPALIALWLPAVLIGVWGVAAFPGLEGKASDKIFSLMVSNHLPPALGVVGFLAVLAAVMSTLDAQLLTLSSMLVRDCLKSDTPKHDVRYGRIFSVVLAVLVYLLAQVLGKSVFEVAFIAFCGYVTLVPTLFLGVRWKRFTVTGAVASIVLGNTVYFMGLAGWLPLFGFLPVFWALIVGIAAAVLGSLWSAPADAELTLQAFGAD